MFDDFDFVIWVGIFWMDLYVDLVVVIGKWYGGDFGGGCGDLV